MSDDSETIGRLLQSTEDTATAVRDLTAAQRADSGRLARVEQGQDAQTAALRDLRGAIDGLRLSVEDLRVSTVQGLADVRREAHDARATAVRAHERIDRMDRDIGAIEGRVAVVERAVSAIEDRREGLARFGGGLRGLLQGAAAGATAAAAIVGFAVWALARV